MVPIPQDVSLDHNSALAEYQPIDTPSNVKPYKISVPGQIQPVATSFDSLPP